MDYYMYQLSCCLYTCIYEGIIYLYFVWKEKVYWQVNWSKRILLCMAFWRFSWRLCIYNFRLICSILSLFFHIFVHSSSFLTPTYSFWGCIAVTISIFLSIHYWDNINWFCLVCLCACLSAFHSSIYYWDVNISQDLDFWDTLLNLKSCFLWHIQNITD